MEGKVFQGRYRLIERIGSGGMADVYRAEDTVLSRPVALKVLYRSLADDPDFVERFRREAKSAASLSHPNIVAIYDWGAEDSTYFIVMEFVEGESLKERIRRLGALSQHEAVKIAKEVASALAYAHKKGVVHRDVKPHNIILTHEGEVKVTDFGIARAGASSITQTGTILGTAHYISPEQARGEEVGPASDIYSAGIILYEMLTGRVPFDGENPVSIALKQIEENPPLPSILNRSITIDLEKVVMKCLAKDPSLRYRDADELKDDLSRVESGFPVAAPPTETTMVIPFPERKKPKRRLKRAIISSLIAVFLLAAAFGAGFALYIMNRPTVEKVTIPKVVGLTLDQARSLLESKKLKVRKSGEEYSETIAEGQIIRQSPSDGSEGKAGDSVTVVVSLGKPIVVVPNVIGETSDNATSKMMKAGLEPSGENAYAYSDRVPAGRVIYQSPEPGSSVRKGTPFTLKISRGPETVQLPDVYNKGMQDAKAGLEQLGFSVSVSEEFNDSVPSGQVIRTAPPAGATVDKGSSVTLVVSKGPELIAVPNVKGMTETDARAALQQAGFDVKVEYIPGSSKPGEVFAQTPRDGELLKRGSMVVIYIGQKD